MQKQARFAARVADGVRRLGIEHVSYDPQTFTLLLAGHHRVSLEAAFADYRRTPFWLRREVIHGCVESIKWIETRLPGFEVVRDRLFPRLRQRAHHAFHRLRGLRPEAAHATLADNLAIELVYDVAPTPLKIEDEHLERWGVTFDDAYAAAVANLSARSRDDAFAEPAPGVFVAPWRDGMSAARLTLIDRLLALPLKGAPVAAVPHRDLLVVTGAADDEGLAALGQLVASAADDERALSPIPVLWNEGRWVPHLPARSHVHHGLFKRLHLAAAARMYREQAPLLAAAQPGVTIGGYLVSDGEDGRNHSTCMWRQDSLPALLPRVDYLVLIDRNERVSAPTPWAYAAQKLGPLVPQGLYPQRYRVEHFPIG